MTNYIAQYGDVTSAKGYRNCPAAGDKVIWSKHPNQRYKVVSCGPDNYVLRRIKAKSRDCTCGAKTLQATGHKIDCPYRTKEGLRV